MNKQCDYVFKFIIIGDTGTGKSCALHQFIEGDFKAGVHKHTIGVEYGSKVITLAGKKIKLQIWDTAGQERFRSVTRSYYRNAAAALIFYSINDSSTFDHLSSWLVDSRQMGRKDISVVLTGNKSDLKDERQVTFLEASRFAQENESLFLETSALTGENVEEVFLKAARSVLSKIESGVIDPKSMVSGGLRPDPSQDDSNGVSFFFFFFFSFFFLLFFFFFFFSFFFLLFFFHVLRSAGNPDFFFTLFFSVTSRRVVDARADLILTLLVAVLIRMHTIRINVFVLYGTFFGTCRSSLGLRRHFPKIDTQKKKKKKIKISLHTSNVGANMPKNKKQYHTLYILNINIF